MRGSIFWSESRETVRESDLKFLRHRDKLKQIKSRVHSSILESQGIKDPIKIVKKPLASCDTNRIQTRSGTAAPTLRSPQDKPGSAYGQNAVEPNEDNSARRNQSAKVEQEEVFIMKGQKEMESMGENTDVFGISSRANDNGQNNKELLVSSNGMPSNITSIYQDYKVSVPKKRQVVPNRLGMPERERQRQIDIQNQKLLQKLLLIEHRTKSQHCHTRPKNYHVNLSTPQNHYPPLQRIKDHGLSASSLKQNEQVTEPVRLESRGGKYNLRNFGVAKSSNSPTMHHDLQNLAHQNPNSGQKIYSSRMSHQMGSMSQTPVVGNGIAFHAINNKRKQLLQIDDENAKLYMLLQNKSCHVAKVSETEKDYQQYQYYRDRISRRNTRKQINLQELEDKRIKNSGCIQDFLQRQSIGGTRHSNMSPNRDKPMLQAAQ